MRASWMLGVVAASFGLASPAAAEPTPAQRSKDSSIAVDDDNSAGVEATAVAANDAGTPVLPPSWAAPPGARPHYGRAAVEMFGFLGLGAVWYWLDIERNLADWDRLSLEQRFSWSAVRLDNNEFFINHVAHPFVGASYYAFARSNGLSVFEAAVYTKLTSMAWEYGLEFQERTSYNDFFVTPLAGIALGEAFHSLGLYLNSGHGTPMQDALAWSFGFPTALHRTLDGVLPAPVQRRDALGFDADVAHEFEASYGVGALRTARTDTLRHSFRLSSELIAIPGYGTSKPVQRWFTQGLWTRLSVATHFSTEPSGLEFSGDSVLLGVHQQDGGARAGYAVTTGLGLGFDYSVFRSTDFKQQAGLLHIGGLQHKGLWRVRDLQLEVRARVSPDFSAINSPPYEDWWAARDDTADLLGKSILRKQGYYYGWGWTSALGADLRWKVLSLGAAASYHSIESISGLDRIQEDIDLEERANDDWDTVRVYARLMPPAAASAGTMRGRLRPFAEVSFDRLRRRSRLEDVTARRRLTETSLRFGLEF